MLDLINISKGFARGTSREHEVLVNLRLHLEAGAFGILLGGNGSGKSTLLRIIAGEIASDSGSILVNQQDVTDLQAYRRAGFVAYVRQTREQNLADNLTVAETFALATYRGASLLSFIRQARLREYCLQLMNKVKKGLERQIDSQLWSLSGGEHQIVTLLVAAEIVRNGTNNKGILLLDEHVAHLDPATSRSVLQITSDLNREHRLTTLMVTHNPQIAADYGDKVFLLKDKRIIFEKRYVGKEARDVEELRKLLN